MEKSLFKILLTMFIITLVHTLSASANTIIDVQDYGAIVDDEIDDYYAIQSAIEALDQTKNGTLVFHKGIYNINHHKIDDNVAVQKIASSVYKEKFPHTKSKLIAKVTYLDPNWRNIQYKSTNNIKNFTFSNYTNLTIEGNGAIFKFDGNWTRTADYTILSNNDTYSRHNAIGIEIISSTNVLIRNLELNGGADKTIKVATREGFSSGIMIGGSSYVTINNVYAHHYHADGLYIYATKNSGKVTRSAYINVSNSRFKNNARQGCSIVGARYLEFYNCAFSNTGNTGKYGSHLPTAGVDIEPHHDVMYNGDIIFEKCNFIDNLSFPYIGSNPTTTPYPIEFKYCTFSSNGLTNPTHAAVVPASRKTEFTNCFFNEVSMWANYGAKDRNAHVDVNVYNSIFKNRRIAQMVLHADRNTNLRWNIENSLFQLNATANDIISPYKRFYLRGNKDILLKSNKIEMSKEEYQTYKYAPDIKFTMDNSVITQENNWIQAPIPPNFKYIIIYNMNGIIIFNKISL